MSIPRIIHQAWKNDDVPSQLAAFQSAWQRLNPGWNYQFWTDETSRMFIAEHYDWFLPVYDNYDVPIKKADVVRYALMYHFGGIYADLDLEPVQPLDWFLDNTGNPELIIAQEPLKHCRMHNRGTILSNAFLASVPGHPVWRDVLTFLVERAGCPDPLTATGPFLLTDYYRSSKIFRSAVHLLDPVAVNPFNKFEMWSAFEIGVMDVLRKRVPPQSLAIHHWMGSWWRDPDQVEQFINSLN